ncbi:hypothetical protein ACHWQZ_G012431 [Mnemiopsis leidyi]
MLRIILFGLLFVQLRCAPAPFDCKREDVDFMGADIGYRTAISIQECIDYCKDTEGCVSFTYRDSTKSCWMKNKRGGQRGPTVQGGLVSMNMDCTDTKSDQSCLQENTDFWGADLASGRAINLDQCETFCRDTRDCVSITYRSSDSQCWLKYNRFGAAGPSNKNGLTSLNMECKVAPQNETCKRIDVDFWGADIGHVIAESLDKCEELCRETEGCVSLTYRASSNSCWRKNKRGGQRGPTVQGGLVSMNMDCTDTKSDQSCLQENTDFWGADLASGRAINLDQCETFCRDTRDCVSITYRSSDSQCWLKYNRFGAAGPSHKIGLTSLNMECKVAPQNENCKRIDVDFWGADIGHVTAESLDKCEELCRETEGCVSLTYRASSNSCWRKNKRGGQRGPTVQGGLVSMNMDCTDTKSDQSCLQENTDFWGADLASGRAINLDQCETFCRDTRDCVSITYRSSDSQCWLKYNRFGAAGPSHRNGLTSLNMECKVAPQNDTCKRIDVDFWGADIGHVTAESLDKCEELCRGTEGCVSLTYRASSNSCWRKNKRGGQRGPTVQGGLVSMNMDCTDTKSDQSCLQENTDFWGADLASGRAINLDQCETFCRDTRDCVSITYRSSDSQCWLKYNRFGAAGPSHTNGLTSLNMECFDVKA